MCNQFYGPLLLGISTSFDQKLGAGADQAMDSTKLVPIAFVDCDRVTRQLDRVIYSS